MLLRLLLRYYHWPLFILSLIVYWTIYSVAHGNFHQTTGYINRRYLHYETKTKSDFEKSSKDEIVIPDKNQQFDQGREIESAVYPPRSPQQDHAIRQRSVPDKTQRHYFLLVLILCNSAQKIDISRQNWNKEAYHRSHGVSLKILYLVGKYSKASIFGDIDILIEPKDDVIKVDVLEDKKNLTLKFKEGLRVAQELYSFDYILKTDIDVFNNYTRWQEKIQETSEKIGRPVLYGATEVHSV